MAENPIDGETYLRRLATQHRVGRCHMSAGDFEEFREFARELYAWDERRKREGQRTGQD